MADITVANPGNGNDIRANFNTAHSSASPGDRLILPAGTFTVTQQLTVTKPVSVIGQGISSTQLYRDASVSDATLESWEILLWFQINSNIPANITVSGIKFTSKFPEIIMGDGGSRADDIGIEMDNCVDFKIHDCRFEYFGNGGVSVTHKDHIARGIIYNNQFYFNAKGYDGLGLGYGVVIYGASQKWIKNPRYGSKNFIFIEDNTFDYHRHSIAAGSCALYVARHNTFTNNIRSNDSSIQVCDAHAARGGSLGSQNTFSTRAVEIYNNSMVNTTFLNGTTITPGGDSRNLVERAIMLHGGAGMIYNNTISGFRFASGASIDQEPYLAATYPYNPYSMGWLSGMRKGASHTGTDSQNGEDDIYYYSNTFTPYVDLVHISEEYHDYGQGFFAVNRDWQLSAKPGYVAYPYPHPMRT